MTTTPEPPTEAAFFTAIRNWGITRGPNGVVGGVVEGLGQRVGMAPVPARIIVVVGAFLLPGIVLLGYAGAWGLLPDREGNIIIQNFGRGVTNVGALIGIGVLLLFGLGTIGEPSSIWPMGPGGALDWNAASGEGGLALAVIILFGFVIPLAVLASIVWLIVYLVRRSNQSGAGSQVPGAAGTAPTTAATGAASAAPATAKGSTTASAAVPSATTAAVPPPVPPVPPRPYIAAPPPVPRVPGPGRGGYLGALALGILAAAAVAWTARLDRLAVNPVLAWFALFVLGLGLILIIVSATGRKLGFLGFISVPLAVIGFVIGSYGEELREAYDEVRANIEAEWEAEWESEWDAEHGGADIDSGPVDPTAIFAGDYSQVFFAPECYAGDFGAEIGAGAPVARFAFAEFTEDVNLDVVAEYTHVSVPAGTNVVLEADGWAQSAVAWPDRDLWCDFWDGDQRNFSLINPGAPTLTLTVFDDDYANTIIITETAATTAPVDEEVQP